MNLIPDRFQHAAKTVVAVLGALAVLAAQVLPSLPDNWQTIVSGALAVLTALGVYHVPNVETVGDEDSEEVSE